MYEPRHQKPIARKQFTSRFFKHCIGSAVLILISLFAGMLGYHLFENLDRLDAFLNAAMLLGGMGPVDPPRTETGKLFAGIYALYAGLVFLIAAGLIVAPAIHRMLHLFHWDERKNRPNAIAGDHEHGKFSPPAPQYWTFIVLMLCTYIVLAQRAKQRLLIKTWI